MVKLTLLLIGQQKWFTSRWQSLPTDCSMSFQTVSLCCKCRLNGLVILPLYTIKPKRRGGGRCYCWPLFLQSIHLKQSIIIKALFSKHLMYWGKQSKNDGKFLCLFFSFFLKKSYKLRSIRFKHYYASSLLLGKSMDGMEMRE